MNGRRRSLRGQGGVGLIEVLVALLVLSVGFLAAGRMQLGALRQNQDAYHESQARLLLDDMMDRMRINRAGVLGGAYDDKSTATAKPQDCVIAACDVVALARRDLHEWRRALVPTVGAAQPRLPAGASDPAIGTIGLPVDGVYTLTLSWTGLSDGNVVTRTADARFVP